MSQCGLDDNNPYGREWGVLALRNLTEGNQKNQDYIKEMNPVKVKERWRGKGGGGVIFLTFLFRWPKTLNLKKWA